LAVSRTSLGLLPPPGEDAQGAEGGINKCFTFILPLPPFGHLPPVGEEVLSWFCLKTAFHERSLHYPEKSLAFLKK